MKVYSDLKETYEREGYLAFVGIVTWAPEDRSGAMDRFFKIISRPEGEGVKGVHTWNLIGRDTMIVIGWARSSVSLQKFSASITLGSKLSIELCPAIDHFGLQEAFKTYMTSASISKAKAIKRKSAT
ncbi:MAG: hypothetical protein EHM49_09135 [Deltaproteobacteria bacterium]|nr:MAG: hypothetical protein EHM49_09135 [Deltaproteobacteria bacterium]